MEPIKTFLADGIEVNIYVISGKHPYRLVLRDTDADEMVGAVHFVDLDQAIAYAEKCLL